MILLRIYRIIKRCHHAILNISTAAMGFVNIYKATLTNVLWSTICYRTRFVLFTGKITLTETSTHQHATLSSTCTTWPLEGQIAEHEHKMAFAKWNWSQLFINHMDHRNWIGSGLKNGFISIFHHTARACHYTSGSKPGFDRTPRVRRSRFRGSTKVILNMTKSLGLLHN